MITPTFCQLLDICRLERSRKRATICAARKTIQVLYIRDKYLAWTLARCRCKTRMRPKQTVCNILKNGNAKKTHMNIFINI